MPNYRVFQTIEYYYDTEDNSPEEAEEYAMSVIPLKEWQEGETTVEVRNLD